MGWRIEQQGEHAVATFDGSLDVHTSPQLRKFLQGAIADGARLVTLDMAAVSYLDASSLGVLVAAERRLQALQGSIRVVNATPSISSLFELTGMASRFGLEQP